MRYPVGGMRLERVTGLGLSGLALLNRDRFAGLRLMFDCLHVIFLGPKPPGFLRIPSVRSRYMLRDFGCWIWTRYLSGRDWVSLAGGITYVIAEASASKEISSSSEGRRKNLWPSKTDFRQRNLTKICSVSTLF